MVFPPHSLTSPNTNSGAKSSPGTDPDTDFAAAGIGRAPDL